MSVPKVLEVLNSHVQTVAAADVGDRLGEFDDADGAGDLVVDGELLGSLPGVDECEPCQPLDGVLDADEGLALLALAVDGHRVAGDGLGTEAVGDRPEVVVKVKPGLEAVVRAGLLGLGAVGDGGPDVGDGQAKLLGRKPEVGGVV